MDAEAAPESSPAEKQKTNALPACVGWKFSWKLLTGTKSELDMLVCCTRGLAAGGTSWVNVTPAGSAPASRSAGSGDPVAVTVNAPGAPSWKVMLFALVMAAGIAVWLTMSEKLCMASLPSPLSAVKVIEYVPGLAGVPPNSPVEELKVTPFGSAPASLNVGEGKPVAVTLKLLGAPAVNVVLFELVR